ncbi:MAG: hypothetical protein AAGA99_00520 [Actinomycetota bacterium]
MTVGGSSDRAGNVGDQRSLSERYEPIDPADVKVGDYYLEVAGHHEVVLTDLMVAGYPAVLVKVAPGGHGDAYSIRWPRAGNWFRKVVEPDIKAGDIVRLLDPAPPDVGDKSSTGFVKGALFEVRGVSVADGGYGQNAVDLWPADSKAMGWWFRRDQVELVESR